MLTLTTLVDEMSTLVADKIIERLQVFTTKTEQTSSHAPELYTAKEVCQLLSIKRQTLHKWEKNGKLIPIRLHGSHLRYSRKDVEGLLKGGAHA